MTQLVEMGDMGEMAPAPTAWAVPQTRLGEVQVEEESCATPWFGNFELPKSFGAWSCGGVVVAARFFGY